MYTCKDNLNPLLYSGEKNVYEEIIWILPKSKVRNRYLGTGSTEGPKPKRLTQRHIIIKTAKVKNKEDSKSSKRRANSQLWGSPSKQQVTKAPP